jgi:hypothetical protein
LILPDVQQRVETQYFASPCLIVSTSSPQRKKIADSEVRMVGANDFVIISFWTDQICLAMQNVFIAIL